MELFLIQRHNKWNSAIFREESTGQCFQVIADTGGIYTLRPGDFNELFFASDGTYNILPGEPFASHKEATQYVKGKYREAYSSGAWRPNVLATLTP